VYLSSLTSSQVELERLVVGWAPLEGLYKSMYPYICIYMYVCVCIYIYHSHPVRSSLSVLSLGVHRSRGFINLCIHIYVYIYTCVCIYIYHSHPVRSSLSVLSLGVHRSISGASAAPLCAVARTVHWRTRTVEGG